MTPNDPPAPFDEQAALAELERLQAAIQLARRERIQVNDRFDAFVRTMKQHPEGEGSGGKSVRGTDRPPREAAPPVASAPAVASAAPVHSAPPPSQVPRAPEPAASRDPLPAVASQSSSDPESVSARVERALGGKGATASSRPLMIGGALLVLALLVFVMMRAFSGNGTEGAPTQTAVAPAPQPSAAAPVAQPAPPPKPAAPLELEIATTRPSWLRVTIDGQKIMEREVKAGERLRYSANSAIVLRAGDAGAVHVSVNGAAAVPVGRDGQPSNRTYTVPAPR